MIVAVVGFQASNIFLWFCDGLISRQEAISSSNNQNKSKTDENIEDLTAKSYNGGLRKIRMLGIVMLLAKSVKPYRKEFLDAIDHYRDEQVRLGEAAWKWIIDDKRYSLLAQLEDLIRGERDIEGRHLELLETIVKHYVVSLKVQIVPSEGNPWIDGQAVEKVLAKLERFLKDL